MKELEVRNKKKDNKKGVGKLRHPARVVEIIEDGDVEGG